MSGSDITTALATLNLCDGGDAALQGGTVTLDKFDKDKYADLSDDGLTARVSGPAWQNVRATVGAKEGKVYWELTVIEVSGSGLVRVGWSTDSWAMDRHVFARSENAPTPGETHAPY